MNSTPQSTGSAPPITLPSPIPSHPRLMASRGDWGRLREQIGHDPVSSSLFTALQKKAASLLDTPPVERTMTGYRLLAVSRLVLERISLLSIVSCVGGDARYARRAVAEMIQVAKFTDWNPSHYLDTAEMALAMAIGYDWLNDHLAQGERDLIASALLEKGIAPSLAEPEQWFIRGNNNWNQVCHAGVSAAAIALADREPELCRSLLQRAVDNLPASAIAYAPDGAYPEGPTYWNYGTLFHTVLADSLQRFLGTTCGVDAYEGFAASAEYIAQITSPTGYFYPYADSRKTRHLLIPLFWLARQFSRPDWLAADLRQVERYMELYETLTFDDSNYRLLALALLWHESNLPAAPNSAMSPHWLGRGTMPVAAHRSAFNDPLALYAAIKGGSPSLNHAHMDAGSFMIQSDGIIWALDPGMEEYERLESLNVNLWDARPAGTRWTVFRLGPEGHNILRFDGAPQLVEGSARFIRFQAGSSTPHSVLDLSPLYTGSATQVHRGFMFLENRALLIHDEWTAGDLPVTVSWQMLTTAEVSVQPGEITLIQEGKKLLLRILDPTAVDVQVLEASSLRKPYDAPDPHARRIDITLRTEARRTGYLRILAVQGAARDVAAPVIQSPLQWSAPRADLCH